MKTGFILIAGVLLTALPLLAQEAPKTLPLESRIEQNLAEMDALAKEIQKAHSQLKASLQDLGAEVATGIAGLDKPLAELLEKVGVLLQSAPEAEGLLPKEALEGIKIGVTQAKEAYKMGMGQLAQGRMLESILAQSGLIPALEELAKQHHVLAEEFAAVRSAPPAPEREKDLQELAVRSKELFQKHREALENMIKAAEEVQKSREEVRRELLENEKVIQAEIGQALAEAQGEIAAALAGIPKAVRGSMAPKLPMGMNPNSPEWKKALEEYIRAVQPSLEAVHNAKAIAEYGKLAEKYLAEAMAPSAQAGQPTAAAGTYGPRGPKAKLSVDVVNEDFQSAIVRLARLWGAEVTFNPKAMPQGRVTAILKNKTFQGALEALCKPVNATYRVENGVYHLSQQKR